jgi:hypothetical protein
MSEARALAEPDESVEQVITVESEEDNQAGTGVTSQQRLLLRLNKQKSPLAALVESKYRKFDGAEWKRDILELAAPRGIEALTRDAVSEGTLAKTIRVAGLPVLAMPRDIGSPGIYQSVLRYEERYSPEALAATLRSAHPGVGPAGAAADAIRRGAESVFDAADKFSERASWAIAVQMAEFSDRRFRTEYEAIGRMLDHMRKEQQAQIRDNERAMEIWRRQQQAQSRAVEKSLEIWSEQQAARFDSIGRTLEFGRMEQGERFGIYSRLLEQEDRVQRVALERALQTCSNLVDPLLRALNGAELRWASLAEPDGAATDTSVADSDAALDVGRLVELPHNPEIVEVTFDFQRLIEEVSVDPQHLLKLTPRQFEELVAEIWSRLGYEVELTARTRDGGRDVVAVKRAEAEVRFLIECKRYAPSHKVGVHLVRALFGVLHHERANKAILATTASFTRGAIEFVESHRWLLELRDYDGIRDWQAASEAGSDGPTRRSGPPSITLDMTLCPAHVAHHARESGRAPKPSVKGSSSTGVHGVIDRTIAYPSGVDPWYLQDALDIKPAVGAYRSRLPDRPTTISPPMSGAERRTTHRSIGRSSASHNCLFPAAWQSANSCVAHRITNTQPTVVWLIGLESRFLGKVHLRCYS